MRRIAPCLVSLLALASIPAAASEISFVSPRAFGPVDLGQRVAYEVNAPCDDVRVHAVVRSDAAEAAGPESAGCTGTVAVPAEDVLGSIAPHEVRGIALVATAPSGTAEHPLRPKRLEAEHALRQSGTFEVGPADDPFGGGDAVAVTGSGSRLEFGRTDLSSVSAIALRVWSNGTRVCAGAAYCRAGRVLVHSGDGSLLTVIDIPATTPARPWQRVVSEPLRAHPRDPVPIYVTFLEAVPGGCGPAGDADLGAVRCSPDPRIARVNYLELIGSGVAEPHAFGPDPGNAVTLFDGTSFGGWRLAGCCGFAIEPDGSMRSVGGYGLFWYAGRTFGDFVLRLAFKVDSPDANSGIFVRFADPGTSPTAASSTGYEVQVQDYGQAYPGSSDLSQTGAIYSFSAAERIPTRTVGEWNQVEVTAVGQDYTVAIDGRVVNRFTGERRLDGYIGVQCHDPSGTVWYRDIRAIPL